MTEQEGRCRDTLGRAGQRQRMWERGRFDVAWSFENGIPIYQQIITELKMQIAAGIYQPDDRLPPVRELAMDAGVNPNTMQRALAQMEQEGVLYTNSTAGRHVASDPEKIRSLRKQIAEDEIARMFGKLQGIGMSKEEITSAVDAWSREA